jgi:hypothetical protein
MQKGNPSRAKKKYEDSVTLMREIGNKSFLAYPLRRLGYLALQDNDALPAWNYLMESLVLNREVGDKRAVAACLTSLAVLAERLDAPDLATRLLGLVENRLDALAVSLLYMDQAELGKLRNRLLNRLDEERFNTAFGEGWEMNEDEGVETARKIVGRTEA